MLERAKGHWAERIGVVALVAVVLAGAAYGWVELRTLLSGVTTPSALDGRPRPGGDTNILLMGLDAPHSYDADVLMLLHVPADGNHPTVISIPRDDYTDLAGCPGGVCRGKIKQAYSFAFAAASKRLTASAARDAGRAAEIATVQQFLGGVTVDHFVEVTLAAFVEIAEVVQPITVCLTDDTHDSYSGADFHRGQQQISAEQAVAFVGQRRDPQREFTDLDRERRQQAFILSLVHQLKETPGLVGKLIPVAQGRIAVDSGLDLRALVQQAASFELTLATLPVERFGKDSRGEDINIVDPVKIRAAAARLLGRATPPPTAGPEVDVVNGSGREGLAARVGKVLPSRGYRAGRVSSGRRVHHTVVHYGRGDSASAAKLVAALGGGYSVAYDGSLGAGELKLVLGGDFRELSEKDPVVPVAPPIAAEELSGDGVPCVK
ncbi:LCP family protein [Amycolatopsis jejuensis]|uniref:LCP family protein n=1 Tax=Amycolatopsis jejuensis TaxID=330084 RepID=UPI000526892D|nr:LCP family protein [Amycolatopsis jejuensis]